MVICIVSTQSDANPRPRHSLFCFHAPKRFSVTPLLATLTNSASRKSFLCHSYENTRSGMGPVQIFLLRNYSLLTTHYSLSPLESADPRNSRVTPLQSADPKTKHLKSFRIRTYKKGGGEGGKRLTRNPSRSAARHTPNFQRSAPCPELRRVELVGLTSHQSLVASHRFMVTSHQP